MTAHTNDDGFTLVEVIVAMLVFAIVMTGFLYTVTAALVTTRDTRARVVAANLAAQQIDLARSAASVFDITNHTLAPITLNGDTFHVAVTTSWITDGGTAASCEAGTATGALSYKQVSVEVTWDNMRGGAQPVRSDTVMAPKTKINNPTLGTVLVGVVNAAGTAVAGATVSLAPANVPAATTDSDGCAYLLKVPPADTYTVTVSKPGYVGYANGALVDTPSATVSVTAGNSSRVSFAFDKATTFTATYAPDAPATTLVPTDLTTTFLSTYGTFPITTSGTGLTKTFTLFPFSSGYSVVAGAYVESSDPGSACLAPDPGQWAAESDTVATRPAPVAGTPGGAASVDVGMGVIRIPAVSGTNTYLKAEYVGGGDGDPGCKRGMTYTFGSVLSSRATTTIALPYGTWKLYRGSRNAQTTAIDSGLTLLTDGAITAQGIVLDPRTAG
ncbi:carboxypeptidase regulatory-like domain-containing protein [Microbacterium luticocti]|uniref:carboxypeptidase regulatory-like domain-containing protein n=1 Tax=Microbacterium luticocti TaxID=451764 RepID=UPI00055D5F89|nr:carboxypeptidase regulatory-like domain-containing protein [Microbacterium luticocti]